jgi:hypothetical protein
MPVYDEGDKAALLALVRKYQRVWYDRDRDKKIKASVEARLETYEPQVERLKAAFAIFGVEGFKREHWDQLAKDLGEEEFYSSIADITYRPAPKQNRDGSDEEPSAPTAVDLQPQPQPQPQPQLEHEPETGPEADTDGGTVREIVLRYLKNSAVRGAKASDIRQHIETLRGEQLHEKTVGMTLYRLSLDGLVRREGRTWFFVPETKNPGGDTPGLINRDTKEGEEL